MVPELNQQWSKACKFIESTGQRQEFQNVRGHVSIVCKSDVDSYVNSVSYVMLLSASTDRLKHCSRCVFPLKAGIFSRDNAGSSTVFQHAWFNQERSRFLPVWSAGHFVYCMLPRIFRKWTCPHKGTEKPFMTLSLVERFYWVWANLCERLNFEILHSEFWKLQLMFKRTNAHWRKRAALRLMLLLLMNL